MRLIKTGGLLLVAACALTVNAQEAGKKKSREVTSLKPASVAKVDDAEKELSPDQQNALSTLNQLFDTLKDVEDEQLRIRLRAQVADLLWEYDEPRARRQFEEAFHSIDVLEEKKTSSPLPFSFEQPPAVQLRREVLGLVSRRDASLAEQFIKSLGEKSTKDDNQPTTRPAVNQGGQADLYFQIAVGIADADPERAAQMARAGLGGGITPSFGRVLVALQQKNPKLADDLYLHALAVAQADAEHVSVNIRTLSPYALHNSGPLAAPGANPLRGGEGTPPADNAVTIQFLNFAYGALTKRLSTAQSDTAALMSRPEAFEEYMIAQQMLPLFNQYLPDKGGMFQSLLYNLSQGLPKNKGYESLSNFMQQTSVEDVLKRADAAGNVMERDLLYMRAVNLASGKGDFDQALSLIEKIGSEDFRSGMDAVTRSQATAAAIRKGDVDEAYRYAKDVADVRQRASLLGSIAQALLDKKDMARATKVLDDAQQLVDKVDDDGGKAQGLLIIAGIKARLNPVDGFQATEAAVKVFNRADEKGEVKPSGGSILSMMVSKVMRLDAPDFDPSFGVLARNNFIRALQLAQSLKKADRSALAQLAVCRGVLKSGRKS